MPTEQKPNWTRVDTLHDTLSNADLYTYVMTSSEEEHDKSVVELFPAVDPGNYDVLEQFAGQVVDELPDDLIDLKKAFNFLGFAFYTKDGSDAQEAHREKPYQNDNLILIIPSAKALTYRLKLLQAKFPSILKRPFRIFSAEGIASDEEFVRRFLEHDIIYANGDSPEAVHDAFYHVARRIYLMLCIDDSDKIETFIGIEKNIVRSAVEIIDNYASNKDDVQSKIRLTQEELDLLWLSLGMFVDYSSSSFTISLTAKGLLSELNPLTMILTHIPDAAPRKAFETFLHKRGITDRAATGFEICRLWANLYHQFEGKAHQASEELHEHILKKAEIKGGYLMSEEVLSVYNFPFVDHFPVTIDRDSTGKVECYWIEIKREVIKVDNEEPNRAYTLPDAFIKHLLKNTDYHEQATYWDCGLWHTKFEDPDDLHERYQALALNI